MDKAVIMLISFGLIAALMGATIRLVGDYFFPADETLWHRVERSWFRHFDVRDNDGIIQRRRGSTFMARKLHGTFEYREMTKSEDEQYAADLVNRFR